MPPLNFSLPKSVTHYNPEHYVRRPELEEEVSKGLTNNGNVTLYGPTKMGKSWLLRHVLGEQERSGAKTAVVSLTLSKREKEASHDYLLREIAHRIVANTGGERRWVDETWSELLPAQGKLDLLMEELVLPSVRCPLVLAFDRGDDLARLDNGQPFFQLVRAWHGRRNGRRAREPWARLQVILLMQSIASTREHALSAFYYMTNAASLVYVGRFGRTEVHRLLEKYEVGESDEAIDRLLKLVACHPFFVHTAVAAAAEGIAFDRIIEDPIGAIFMGIFAEHFRELRSELLDQPKLFDALISAFRQGSISDEAAYIELERMGLVQNGASGVEFCSHLHRLFVEELYRTR